MGSKAGCGGLLRRLVTRPYTRNTPAVWSRNREGTWSRFRVWALACALVALVACDSRGADDYIDLPPLTPAPKPLADASVELPIPDGAVLCDLDEECDDGVPCTRDVCVQGNYCASVPTDSRCDDGLFCNGAEACIPDRGGCVPGYAVVCADQDVCTIDRCDEATKSCQNTLRDFDGDGEADWHCQGGTDCDDFNRRVGSQAAEICADGVDNDCDGTADETDCISPAHDRCEDALDVTGGGTFSLDLRGAARDYELACSQRALADAVVAFTLDEPSDVRLTARGVYVNGSQEVAGIEVRADCAGQGLECRNAFPGEVRMRGLAAGRYFAIVDVPGAPRAIVTADFSSATSGPGNTSCARAQMLVDGERVSSDLVDVPDTLQSPCGVRDGEAGALVPQSDLVYAFTLEAPHNVALSAVSTSGDPMNLSVRSSCDDEGSTLTCVRGEPADTLLHALDPGTYYAVVEGPSYREVDFNLDYRLLPPTPPPPGDSCTEPVELPLDGSSVVSSLEENQASIETSCDLHASDTVYRFTLSEPTDLLVATGAAGFTFGAALQQTCGDPASDLACTVGRGGRRRFRNLQPGDYSLVLEALDAREVVAALELLPRTEPTAVTGNDTCATAFDVPAAGGMFSGDTSIGFANDYFACGNSRSADAVYRVKLTEPKRVRVSTEGAFDSILYRFDAGTVGTAACDGEFAACNDDAPEIDNVDSQLDEMLPAGTYYYVVDGYHVDNIGDYVVTFEIE